MIYNLLTRILANKNIYSSSDSPPSPPFFWFFLFTRPALPPPYGDFNEKSMCFWESSLTTKDGTFTTCLRTLMCLWRIRVLAWWIDLAYPSLNTWVWRRLSKKSSILRPRTKSSFILSSASTPIRTRRLKRALPIK